MNSGESRTRFSSALQWLIPRARKALCWVILHQQRTFWAISLLIAANIVLVSAWMVVASTKAVVETKLFSSGLLPHLSTLAIIAWLLRDIRNWLVTRIESCICNFKDAVTQLYRCKPRDAVQCQPDHETAKEKPKWPVVVLSSLLWLVWLSLGVSLVTELVTPSRVLAAIGWLMAAIGWLLAVIDRLLAVDWLPIAWLAATMCLLTVSSAVQWKKRRTVVLLSLLWLAWLILGVSLATEHTTSSRVLAAIDRLSAVDWLPIVWLAATTCLLAVSSPPQWKKRRTVVLLSLLWLIWLSLGVSSATEHVTRVHGALPATWSSRVRAVTDWLPAAWLIATTCLLAVSSPAQWKKWCIVVLLSLLSLLSLVLAVSFAAEHWLPATWFSRVLSVIKRLSSPDWLRSAWLVATTFLLVVVLLPAQWSKRQPSTDKNESNVQPVMTFWNYGRNAMTLIRTVLLTWMSTLVYLVASGGLTLTWIGYNVTKDDVQRDKITTSVDSLLHNHFPHYVFEEGTVFSLLFQKGDTTNMGGICPTGDNLEWLKLFKSAIGQCTARADTDADPQDTSRADTGADPQDTSRERPQIEVSGLASVGPGHGGEDVDPDSAALLNLRVANMRTVSVTAVLLADSTPSTLVVDAERKCLCGSSFSDDSLSLADTLTAHCGGAEAGSPDHPIKHRGDHFDVSYTLWSTYGAMHKSVPANDESTPADSLLEFLNRTVRITIQNDACRY